MERITSRQNPLITRLRRLGAEKKTRRAQGVFLCEGTKLVGEALRWGPPPELLAVAEGTAPPAELPAGVRVVEVPEALLRAVSTVETPQGMLAVCRTPDTAPPETLPEGRLLVLDGVQDPGNVGTLLRSAAAFGFDGVLLSDGCASVFAPKTLRASMGAAVRVPVMEVGAMPAAIAALRAKNITCLAAALYQSQPLSAARPGYPGGVCVVIGSEGQGLTEETIAACSGTVRIPMTDRVESLNAGIAGSILLWHFREESL